jgi:hypothetical protein
MEKFVYYDSKIDNISQILWSKFHEEWRKSMVHSDWTYASRIEKVLDKNWIQQHNWKTEIDIVNTKFEDLPSNRKYENLEAAKVAISLVYEKVLHWEEISSESLEEMAEVVHNKWLERNWAAWSFEFQRVSYAQLSEEEKAKDRDQLLQAIEIVKEYLNNDK